MTSFNGVFKRVGVLSIVLLSLASCTKKDSHLNNGATFYVDTVAGTFSPDDLNSNEVVNRKFINFTACLKDNAMASAIMNLKFQIKAGDISITKTTDDRGCLVWQELFAYDPYEDEKQISMSRSITGLQGHSGTEVVNLAYNPWDSDKLIFLKREAAREAESVTVTYARGDQMIRRDTTSGRNVPVPIDIFTTVVSKNLKESFISNMTMQFLKRDFDQYRVNSALSLTIAHQYRMKFSSAIIRRTLSQGSVTQNVNAGHFKFYFALLKEGYDPKTVTEQDLPNYIVSTKEFDTSASLGRFIADVTLRFSNVAALASRMTGVLTIVSLDQPDTFAETSFEGVLSPISGGAPTQGIDLVPSKLNARDLVAKDNAFQAQQSHLSAIEVFDKHSGYVAMPRDPVVVKSATQFLRTPYNETLDIFYIFKKKRLGQALTSYEQGLYGKALCEKYFQGIGGGALQRAHDQCLLNPDKMMFSVVREFVERINDPIPRPVGLPQVETLTVSSGIVFTEAKTSSSGNTTSRSYSVTASLGAELGIPKTLGSFLPLQLSGSIGAKMSAGKEWFVTSGVSTSTNNSTSASMTRGVTISSEGFKFAIDLNARYCFLIAPTPQLESEMGNAPHPKGKYFCADEVDRKRKEEVYYFVNEATGLVSSPLSDNMSSEDNPWRMFIRGTHTYNMFAALFTQKDINLVLEKMPDQDILKQFNEFYVTQEFPGMLTP